MSLDQVVTTKINQMLENGEIDSIVSKQVNDMLHGALRSVFSNYKGVGEDIEKMLTASLRTKLSEISVDQYTSLVAKIIQTRVNNNLLDLSEETVEKALSELLEKAPEKIKLSELVELYKKQFEEEHESGEIFLSVENKGSYEKVTMKQSENDNFERVELCVHDKGRIFNLSTGYGNREPGFFTKASYGFDKTIMDMYCRGTLIELDEEDCSLEYGSEY